MNPKRTFKLLLLVVFIIAGCGNENQSASSRTTDSSTNLGKEPHAESAFDFSRGVTAVSPNLYKQLADTLDIRMVEGIYKPGDSSIMHAHPDFALYVLEGSTVELTGEDGTKQHIEFKKNMAVVLPAATHSAKNIGNNTLRLIVVEVNRPRN